MGGRGIQNTQPLLHQLLCCASGHCLDTPHTSTHTPLRHNSKRANLARLVNMSPAAELLAEWLLRHTDLDDPYLVTILFAKQGHGPGRHSLLIASLFCHQGIVGQDGIVNRLFHSIQFVLGQHRTMCEVKTEPVRRDQRACLLHMLTQNIAQLAVEQVCRRVVAGDIHPPACIHHRPNRVLNTRPAAPHPAHMHDQTRHRLAHVKHLDLPGWSLLPFLIPGQQTSI